MSSPATPVVRLKFLDGLRGLAALYVAIFHAFQIGGIVQTEAHLGGGLLDKAIKALYYVVFSYGYCAVTIFIVLSGYSLMLPVARSKDGRLSGGTMEYLRRRARRIAPPYYAALLLSLALIATVPGMNRPGDYWWSGALPAFDWGTIISHLFLVHNWSGQWINKINLPMWSVAVEWNIYLLLPTVLLPVWRRGGALAMLGVGLALGLLPQFIVGKLPLNERLVAMFTVGCVGACIGFSDEARLARWRDQVPWRAVWLVSFTAFALIMLAGFRFWTHTAHFAWFYLDRYSLEWVKDLLTAVFTAALMIQYARIEASHEVKERPLGLRMLSCNTAALLGRFSYSLYLTHGPILSVFALGCRGAGLSPTASYLLIVLAGTPLSVLFAWGFYWFFERRFATAARRVTVAATP